MRSRVLFLLAAGSLATQADAASATPRAFLRQIIAYETSGHADLRSKAFLALLAPRLRAAVRADMKGADIGVIDADPLCQCQDDSGLTMRVVSLQDDGATAQAVVENRFGDERHRVRFRLAITRRGWRIADIGTPDRPSLLTLLERPNRPVG